MNPLLPLAHKTAGYAIGILTGTVAANAVDFTHTITLGSVLLAVIVVAIAGLSTIRAKVAGIWRVEAEGERAHAQRLEDELAAERKSRIDFDAQQQELRHDLKAKIASLEAQLKVMEARTDLSGALEKIREMNEAAAAVVAQALRDTGTRSLDRDTRTHEILAEIRDKLPTPPIPVQIADEGATA